MRFPDSRSDTPSQWAVRLTMGVLAGVFFGLIGPFGSYDRPLPLRLACWIAAFCVGVTLMVMTIRVTTALAMRWGLPGWFSLSAAASLATAPFSALVGLLFNARYWLSGLGPALEFYGDCLLFVAPLTAAYLFLAPRLRSDEAASPSPPMAAAPSAPTGGLAARLPPRIGRDVIALQMEDHYVRVHTPLGSDLLLLTIGQAIEELGDVEGLRVHRSWWVARSAVQGSAWQGRNLRLRLVGGLEAPVARAQVAALRAAGWLDGAG